MTIKTTGRAGWRQATRKTTDKRNLTAPMHLIAMLSAIKRRVWLIGYDLDEARQFHEANGRHFGRLACCIGLAALRLLTGGLHHV